MTSSTSAELSSRQRTFSLAAIVASAFGVGLSFGIGFPLTTMTLEAWQESKWVIGVAGAAPAIAILIALPLLPAILKRLGPALGIALGCAIASGGFLLLSQADTAVEWIAVRLLMSAGLALPWLAGETWINAVVEDRMRGRVIAIYAMLFFCGFALGPIVLAWLGTSGSPVFLSGAVGIAAAGLPILFVAHLAPDLSGEGSMTAWQAMRLSPIAMVGAFAGGFAEITYIALLPSVALASGIAETATLTLLTTLTVGGILCQFPLGWLADHMDKRRLLIALSVAFVVLSIVLVPALGALNAAYALSFLLGGAIMGFYTVGLAIIGETVGKNDLAPANAAFLVCYQAGAIIGPAFGGAAMSVAPVGGFVLSVCVLMVAGLGLVFWLDRKAR